MKKSIRLTSGQKRLGATIISAMRGIISNPAASIREKEAARKLMMKCIERIKDR